MAFKTLVLAAVLLGAFCSPCLRADLAPRGITTMELEDQGNQLLLRWRFHFRQMAPVFAIHLQSAKDASPQDILTAKQNLAEFVSTAFDLRINGQSIKPFKIVEITPLPDGSCRTTLLYPGHPNAVLEIRAPVLQYFGDEGLVYLRISNSDQTLGGVLSMRKNFASVFSYEETGSNGKHSTYWQVKTWLTQFAASPSFKTAMGTAWVNYNWLFICVVLLVMQMHKRGVILVLAMIACWIVFCLLWVLDSYKFPYQIPEIVLSLPTVLLCWIVSRYPQKNLWITATTLIAAIVNACYDIQQIPLRNPDQAAVALGGLCAGFIAGITLLLVILFPLLAECKKYPGFQANWAPKICWAVGAFAILLPLQKMIFG